MRTRFTMACDMRLSIRSGLARRRYRYRSRRNLSSALWLRTVPTNHPFTYALRTYHPQRMPSLCRLIFDRGERTRQRQDAHTGDSAPRAFLRILPRANTHCDVRRESEQVERCLHTRMRLYLLRALCPPPRRTSTARCTFWFRLRCNWNWVHHLELVVAGRHMPLVVVVFSWGGVNTLERTPTCLAASLW